LTVFVKLLASFSTISTISTISAMASRLNSSSQSVDRLALKQPSKNSSALFRSPRRITITIPYSVFAGLLSVSDEQGRSLSNYAAHLLELSLLQRCS
jgi:hypothetical protein